MKRSFFGRVKDGFNRLKKNRILYMGERNMIVGAQRFTLRDYAKTTEDLSETLKKVADMGYRSVQLSGVCEYDAAWMKEELRKNGLTCFMILRQKSVVWH